MSRIGKKPVTLPKGVKVTVTGSEAVVEGAKGKLTCPIPAGITLDIQADSVNLTRANDEAQTRAYHGLTRALLGNAVTGVTEGWKKELDIVGVGYKAAMDGAKLNLELGYSHPIKYEAPAGIQMAVEKTTHIVVTGIDRQLVGQVAADIRKFRKPEPYKGKGVQLHRRSHPPQGRQDREVRGNHGEFNHHSTRQDQGPHPRPRERDARAAPPHHLQEPEAHLRAGGGRHPGHHPGVRQQPGEGSPELAEERRATSRPPRPSVPASPIG